jgi:hypothetical protein
MVERGYLYGRTCIGHARGAYVAAGEAGRAVAGNDILAVGKGRARES